MVARCPTGGGLRWRRVQVARPRVAWLRYVLEAHEGLGLMHSDGSGTVTLLAPESQLPALDALIADLAQTGDVTLSDAAD